MKSRFDRLHLLFASATLLTLVAACGGGGDDAPVADAPAPAPAPASTTTAVTAKVIDGAIANALVCIDKNINGKCDADEVQGRSDTSGNVTLAVPNDDVGKYPILALVGTDATDADSGPVTKAYAMSAPADQTGVISPLTTLVQQTVASTGATTEAAAASVQQAAGIGVSVFQDYTAAQAPTDGSASAGAVARLLVITTQAQATTVAPAVGTTADDGTVVTQADVDKAIQKKLLELLPDLVTTLGTPAVTSATTPATRDAALLTAATTVLGTSGFTPASIATVVAINNQTAAATAPAAPVAGFNMPLLNFTDASNYVYRVLKSSLAEATPDADNNTRYVDLRVRATAGNVATWGPYSDPTRGSDLHWSGTAWVGCPINFENTSSVRDAQGSSVYNYCDSAEIGKTNRASFDITGKTMATVYAQARAAGYTNMTLASPAVLGTATFPTGSSLLYQATQPLTTAISYNPSGAGNAPGRSNVVNQFSAAVAAGGNAASQGAGVACNSTETNSGGTSSTTLEDMIAAKGGTPCAYAQSTFVYAGVTYTSDATNEWWGNSTVSIGKVGTAAVGAGAAPGFYTGNTLLRAAFTGGANAVSYYACKERFSDGSARNCTQIGTGTWTISTLGDGRALVLNNLPAAASALGYTRVFVERGGFVYFGYQNKPTLTNTARLNGPATNALFTQLGIATIDPSLPVALTEGSYQGTWDIRASGTVPSSTNGFSITFFADGTNSCSSSTGAISCNVSLVPASGDFVLTDTSGSVLNGNLDFQTGTATGTLGGTPVVGARR